MPGLNPKIYLNHLYGKCRDTATRQYMILKQRERVCDTAKVYVDMLCGDTRPIDDAYSNLEKEIRKLRALEGE